MGIEPPSLFIGHAGSRETEGRTGMLFCVARHPLDILHLMFLLASLCWLSVDRCISRDVPHSGVVGSRSS
jgi:hypothetical protein